MLRFWGVSILPDNKATCHRKHDAEWCQWLAQSSWLLITNKHGLTFCGSRPKTQLYTLANSERCFQNLEHKEYLHKFYLCEVIIHWQNQFLKVYNFFFLKSLTNYLFKIQMEISPSFPLGLWKLPKTSSIMYCLLQNPLFLQSHLMTASLVT